MRRSALALGATVMALALTAGPAAAQSGGAQTVTDSTGAAQAGPTEVNVPIRVASDGNDPAPSATVGAPQTADNSSGTAQAGSTEVSAPVRVLSDGKNAPSGGSPGGEQTASDSTGAQAGSVGVNAPIRVASDGDDGGADAAAADGGTVGVGAQGDPVDPLGGDSSPGSGADGGPVGVTQSIPGTRPATDLLSDGSSTSASLQTVAALADEAGGSLPLTGLGLVALLLTGLTLLSSGAAVRRGSPAAG